MQSQQVSQWNAALWSIFHSFSCLLLLLLLLQHDFTGPSQFPQFDLGILCSVQCHLTVLSGWISGTFMRLTSSYLWKRLENCFMLYSVNQTMILYYTICNSTSNLHQTSQVRLEFCPKHMWQALVIVIATPSGNKNLHILHFNVFLLNASPDKPEIVRKGVGHWCMMHLNLEKPHLMITTI